MTQLSLRDRLLRFLRRTPDEWIAKGHIQDLVAKFTDKTPENAGRRLRELEDEGFIEVKYVKGHAWYKAKKLENPADYARRMIKLFDEYPTK